MGVPKFFRWLSERYPLINQRYYAPSGEYEKTHKKEQEPENHNKKYPQNSKSSLSMTNSNDVLQSATLAPEVDRLYIDMNGIIHGCSHNNNEDDGTITEITEAQIFDNITSYLDRVIGDIVRPQEIVYMAIDGVAPRAKLNQQRSRRFRSSSGQEIEQTVYEAHLNTLAEQQRQATDSSNEMEQAELQAQPNNNTDMTDMTDKALFEDGYEAEIGPLPNTSQIKPQKSKSTHKTITSTDTLATDPGGHFLTEVEPGRFAGKFETHLGGNNDLDYKADESMSNPNAETKFHSNSITPGTPFFQRCIDHLERYIRDRIANDPNWKHLTIIFSGPNVPGEGEHKIMDFMRQQQKRTDYNPNLRHCIMGQDGDLIMLGLCTHEPNLVLFREQVIFKSDRRRLVDSLGVDGYVHNPNFGELS
jgi:5'-3' exonuclease